MDVDARGNNGTIWYEGQVVSDSRGVLRFELTWRPKALLGGSTNPNDVAGSYGVVVTYGRGLDGTAYNIFVTNDAETPPLTDWSA